MSSRPWLVGLIGLLTLTGSARCDHPSGKVAPGSPEDSSASPSRTAAPYGIPQIPLDALPPAYRAAIKAVLDHPTLAAKGPLETFNADAGTYRWLLEHPGTGARLWRLLGARVTDIVERDGVYYWNDGQGSDLHWRIVFRDSGTQAWFAEGKVKPAFLLPSSSFRAFVVLKYTAGKDLTDRPAIRHQVHFLLHCDSGAMALAARILGASAPRLAEQYIGQLQLFYGGLAWYLCQDEKRARKLFERIGMTMPDFASR
jgi:hypothetical protein